MFCTSLRRRPSYASIIPRLISTSTLGLLENELKTHDVALTLSTDVDPRTGRTMVSRRLRVLLLSPSRVSDKQLPNTLERICHLMRLSATQDIAVVFLLEPSRDTNFQSAKQHANGSATDGHDHSTAGIHAYSKFLAEVVNQYDIPSIPILPVVSLEELPSLLQKHANALASQQAPREARKPAATAMEVLSCCTVNPQMRQETAYVLSDIFPNLRELAQACAVFTSSSRSSSPSTHAAYEKLKQLRDLVGEEECQNIIEFWRSEYEIGS